MLEMERKQAFGYVECPWNKQIKTKKYHASFEHVNHILTNDGGRLVSLVPWKNNIRRKIRPKANSNFV
jgi:hypothetical protein